MTQFNIYHKQLSFETQGNKASFFEIKSECINFINECGIREGIFFIQSPHTTCAVLFEEMVHDIDALGHEYLQADLLKGLESVFLKQQTYDDDYKYPGILHRQQGFLNPQSDFAKNPAILLNGDAHCKATLIGSDDKIIIKDGNLQLGQYGTLYFVDFDSNRARKRNCHLCVIGG